MTKKEIITQLIDLRDAFITLAEDARPRQDLGGVAGSIVHVTLFEQTVDKLNAIIEGTHVSMLPYPDTPDTPDAPEEGTDG